MPESTRVRRVLHDFFEISIIIKGIDGVLEVLLSSVIFFFNRHFVRDFLLFFVQGELNENPRDWLSNQILHLGNHITPSSEFFMGLYFFVNGMVKILLVYGLLTKKAWSFPSALAILSAFSVYEAFRFSHTHSLVLAILFMIDVGTIFLIADEWKSRPTQGRHAEQSST